MFEEEKWYFHLVVERPQTLPKEEKGALGVDFGETVLAATSSGKLFVGVSPSDGSRQTFLLSRIVKDKSALVKLTDDEQLILMNS